ncbi:MAG: CRISPR-associated endonuclease Cas2 [Propionibacteriaceae bacterium]|nr:CRISPR-associated endonuclease Cas2 [Propionibacteriaceae bacterium]
MTESFGRWLLVSFDLPSRSKAQRQVAKVFVNWLMSEGFHRIHSTAFARFLPDRWSASREEARIRGHLPSDGRIVAFEVTEKAYSRSMLYVDGMPVTPAKHPELLALYF